jgi:hypothetical protein
MKTTREQFEEIWPVPEGVYWSMNSGHYVCDDSLLITRGRMNVCAELDIRLDTFTRCQETTSIYVGLIDEFIEEVQFLLDAEGVSVPSSCDLIDRAKQIIGREK